MKGQTPMDEDDTIHEGELAPFYETHGGEKVSYQPATWWWLGHAEVAHAWVYQTYVWTPVGPTMVVMQPGRN